MQDNTGEEDDDEDEDTPDALAKMIIDTMANEIPGKVSSP